MAIYTYKPQSAPVTPDPGQGGSAVSGAVTDGHGNTTCTASSGGSQTKTCKWGGFSAAPGGATSVRLKADWSENGSLPTGTNQFKLEYSLNNGSSWTAAFDHVDVTAPGNGAVDIALSTSQDITQVLLRDKLFVQASGAADVNSVTGSVSNIRIEVQTVNQVVVMM